VVAAGFREKEKDKDKEREREGREEIEKALTDI